MNNKGQALVEFVLILPVFLFLLLSIYDFGMMFNFKNELENDSSDIITLYNNGKSLDEIRKIYPSCEIFIDSSDLEYRMVVVSSSMRTVTPGFNRIFGDPYVVKIERYIPYV